MMGVSPFVLCVIVLVALESIGLPIGLSMIGASILYLVVAHLDPGTAAEQILNGLYSSYVLLAVPLFILAADLMNTGSLTDRLLNFCLVLPSARWRICFAANLLRRVEGPRPDVAKCAGYA